MGAGPLELDRVAVRRGALGVIMFVAPAYVIARVGAAGDDASSWWLLIAFAILFGATFGGFAAAHHGPPTPVSHAAVATASGLGIVLGVALLVQLALGDLTLAATLTALVILQIGTALGCLGGLLAARWARA